MLHRLCLDVGWAFEIQPKLAGFGIQLKDSKGEIVSAPICRQLIRGGYARIVGAQLLPTLRAAQYCADNPA